MKHMLLQSLTTKFTGRTQINNTYLDCHRQKINTEIYHARLYIEHGHAFLIQNSTMSHK